MDVTMKDSNGVGKAELFDIPLPNSQTGQVSKDELIRLLADGLRDLGFESSAIALENESGTTSSSSIASEFISLLNAKRFDAALALLDRLPFKEGPLGKRRAKNFIVQERYLELLMQERLEEALARLHEEIFYLHHEDESDLDELAAILACPTLEDRKRFSGRLRARQAKRYCAASSTDAVWGEERSAIDCVRVLLDSEAVVPPHRLLHLLGHALARQAGEHADLRRLEGEPLPLLRDLKEVEESRNASLVPSSNCRRVIPIHGAEGPVEVWCVCFADDEIASKLAIGTRDGTIMILDCQNGQTIETFQHAFGSNRPVISLDWVNPFGLLAVSRSVGRPPNRQGNGGPTRVRSEDGMDEDGADEDSEEEVDVRRCLVRQVMPSAFDLPLATHAGQPFVCWLRDGSIATSGQDGWLKIWSSSPLKPFQAHKVERVCDMVPLPDRRGTVLACADNTIRVFREGSPLFTALTVQDSIVSLACSFNSVVASVRGQSLLVWNLKDVLQAGNPSFASVPAPLVFKGFARKRYVLRPSVGQGDFVATGSEDGNIHIYSSFAASTLPGKEVVILRGHTAAVNQVHFARRVPGLLASVGDDGSVRIWSRRYGDEAE